MAKIAVDIALLLPKEINNMCIDINKGGNSEAYSDLSKPNNHAHITLAMGVIDENDIEKVNNKLQKIVKEFSRLNLEIIKLYTEIHPDNKKSAGFEIKLTDNLKRLHGAIMRELLPIFSYDVKNEMFFLDSDETFTEISEYWIENYGKKHSNPENYRPHISLKCRNAKYSKLPLKFTASKVALCHLGNYCTCRTIISSFEL